MSSRGESTEQPSIEDPGRLCPEHAFLGVALIALTAAIVALIVEHETTVQVLRGGYSILAAVIVVGFTGWFVGAAARRVRREVGAAVAGLTAALAELHVQVAQQRVVYLPAPGRQVGHMYVSSAAQGESIAVPRASVDADTQAADSIAAAREDGIEKGFEIGYRAQLADLGVTPLPRPRRPRLTGDS